NVDLPTLLVTASLPAASPETIASSVAAPLERQFSTIAGLSSMNSVNALGGTQITLQFDLSRNIDAAAQDVQSAITVATPLLPPSMPTPPVYRKVNPADQPILFLALTSPTRPLWTLHEYGEPPSAEQYRPVIVAYRNGSPVRLEELGQVIDSVEDDKTASWYGTAERRQRSIVLAVQRQPGTNTVEVADAVRALLPAFKAWLPPS